MAEVDLEQLMNCALCPNMCRSECPALQAGSREAVAPAGKARLAAMVQNDQLEWSESLLEAVANCLGCRGCTIHCPFPELNLCDELLFSRVGAKPAGALPAWEPYLNNLRKYGSPYGKRQEEYRGATRGGKVLFYAGCTALANNPASVEAYCHLFKQAGVDFQMIEEDCCGYPAETWADLELAKKLASENRAKVERSGAELLVTGCPECWQTFTERYPAWGLQLPLEIVDGSSYLLGLLAEKKLKPGRGGLTGPVTIHDPCILARTAGVISELREIVLAVPGLELVEANPGKDKTRCCGGGRMFQLSFPRTAEAVARKRLEEMPAQIPILTACPFCREGLKTGERKVYELVEIIAEACPEDNCK